MSLQDASRQGHHRHDRSAYHEGQSSPAQDPSSPRRQSYASRR